MFTVLWFSRHTMTEAQRNDLLSKLPEEVDILQVNATVQDVAKNLKGHVTKSMYVKGDLVHRGFPIELSECSLLQIAQECDLVCMVAPLELQSDLFDKIDTPILIPKNKRDRNEQGEFTYTHLGWKFVKNLVIELEDF